MAKYNLENYLEKDGLGFPLNFRRGNPNPLDNSSVWASYAEAKSYAESDPVAYVGQILTVVDNAAGTAAVYSIQNEAGDLSPVGTSPVGDESTITVADDGTVTLYGISGLELTRTEDDGSVTNITYQPLFVNGKLTWVEPSATTVEGLAAEIEGIKTRISAVEAAIGDETSGLIKDIADVDDRVSSVESELRDEIAAAKQSAIETVLGENIDADFDTLQEVAAWIQSDTTNSAELINRVSAIEVDYLKGADKEELQGSINALAEFVGSLPEGTASTTVIAYIQEVVAALSIGDYAKASELNVLAERVSAIETKIATIEEGAQRNVIDAVSEEFVISEDGKMLSVASIGMSKVTGLEDALAAKVSVVEGCRMITTEEGEKLESLVIDEDGKVAVSGTISASNVQGLEALLATKVDVEEGKGLSTNDLTDALLEKLNGIADGAQANVLEGIRINGTEIVLVDKYADIPIAGDILGVVKSSSAENGVTVNEDGTMTVNAISLSKIVQAEDEELVLNGGGASI